ncbi:MAG: flagellar biosynthesis protein FlhF [Burkholderiaceae bacterium]|nr:flagellar biosynthesis protein FlhF [Burkholderiaceae bacterium]
MSTMTFIGRTTREAMSLAKARFGADVQIVDSRQTDDGVELTAIVHGVPLQRRNLQPQVAARAPVAPMLRGRDGLRASGSRPGADAAVPMSTVSFESYVRERQERQYAPAPAAAGLSARLAMPQSPAPSGPVPATGGANRRSTEAQSAVMEELRSIKQFIAGQLETVRWFDTARRRPAQMRLLRLLLARQFSTTLSRSLCDLLPVDFSDAQADHWLQQTLARTLASFCPAARGAADATAVESAFDEGGVFALIGPTGVGKTTTVAKIAAQYAMRHGAGQVALITADVYRIGAQEQLRSFGQMLGVPVHVAHDRGALQELLGLFGDRRLVLIDTAGVSQRDSRVAQLLDALDIEPIRRVVVLNAAMQAASLQEVASAYQAQDAAGVLLSKVDEAVHLGSALDCLIRNRLRLLGFADGQRVPEDFHAADFAHLVGCAMAAPPGTDPADGELDNAEVRFILEGAHV